jgi:hypothetical protein
LISIACQYSLAHFFSFFVLGSGVSEGFNRRLDSVMPRGALALDVMVDFLAEEDKCWMRTRTNPRLWDAKSRESEAAKQRQEKKRRRLSHYLDPTLEASDQVVDLLDDSSNEDVDAIDADLLTPSPDNNPSFPFGKRPCATCK